MKEIYWGQIGGLGEKLAMIILVGTTAITTGTVISKVAKAPKNAEDKVVNSIPQLNGDEQRKVSGFVDLETVVTPTKLVIPTAIATPKPSISPTLINTGNRCLVTLFGKQYDVTSLRNSHGGGDIFQCGTDMSTTYQNKHGSSLNRIAAYLYDPNNPNAVITGSSNKRTRDDWEREEDDD